MAISLRLLRSAEGRENMPAKVLAGAVRVAGFPSQKVFQAGKFFAVGPFFSFPPQILFSGYVQYLFLFLKI